MFGKNTQAVNFTEGFVQISMTHFIKPKSAFQRRRVTENSLNISSWRILKITYVCMSFSTAIPMLVHGNRICPIPWDSWLKTCPKARRWIL